MSRLRSSLFGDLGCLIATDAVAGCARSGWLGSRNAGELQPVLIKYDANETVGAAVSICVERLSQQRSRRPTHLRVHLATAWAQFGLLPQMSSGMRRVDRTDDTVAQAVFDQQHGSNQSARAISACEPSAMSQAIAASLPQVWLDGIATALDREHPGLRVTMIMPWWVEAYAHVRRVLPCTVWVVVVEPGCTLVMRIEQAEVAVLQSVAATDATEILQAMKRVELRRGLVAAPVHVLGPAALLDKRWPATVVQHGFHDDALSADAHWATQLMRGLL